MNDIESVGFLDGGYSTFGRSLGRTPKQSNLYQYLTRQRSGECPQKDKVREVTIETVLEFFKHRKDNVSFLTLPSALWIFEKRILEEFNKKPRYKRPVVYFTACERDWKIFSLAALKMPYKNNGGKFPQKQIMSDVLNCQIIKKDGFTIIQKNIFDFIEVTDRKFDCVWIDTQTPLSYIGHKLRLVPRVFKSKNPCMFILTVLKAREHEEVRDRTEYVQERIFGFDLCDKIEYQDSSGSPMLHLIFKSK